MTLQRLIFKEIIIPFGVALAMITLLLIVMQLLQLNEVLFGGGFNPLGTLRVALYLMPHFGTVAIPLAFLLAILLGLGRMAEDNELFALSALGRSPLGLYGVVLLLSSVLGLAVGFIGYEGEAWGMNGLRRQLNELIKRNVAAEIRPGTFYEDIPRYTIYVAEHDENANWERVLIFDGREEKTPLLLLSQRGEVESEGADSMMGVRLNDGEMHRVDAAGGYMRANFDSARLSVGVSSFFRRRNKFNRPTNELRIGEMPAAAAQARQSGNEKDARRIETAFHARHAAVFSCLIFGLVAVPMAARGRSGRGNSYVATFLAFAGYYVLLTVAAGLGESGRLLPPLAAWVPNIVGFVLAAALFFRLLRNQHAGGER